MAVLGDRLLFWGTCKPSTSSISSCMLDSCPGYKHVCRARSAVYCMHTAHTQCANAELLFITRSSTAGRRAMPSIHAILDTVLEGLARTKGTDVDVNNVALRYAMDVTGMVCFGAAFGTAATFDDSHTNDLFAVLRGGAHSLPIQICFVCRPRSLTGHDRKVQQAGRRGEIIKRGKVF